ncbi:MAG: hypothetical protein LBK41_00870 [Clostridiales bacterium]|jgi:predicted DNA binding CopG/RHH family protein|nr:hypothetical protein [Clostridiales bacterium]
MADRNIGIKVSEELYKKIKVKIANDGKTLKDYVLELIQKDLEIGQ